MQQALQRVKKVFFDTLAEVEEAPKRSKLAHYFGFVLGNELLTFVVPGYSPDQAISSTCGMELQDYLQVDIHKLTA